MMTSDSSLQVSVDVFLVAIDLVKKLLTVDPKKRITVDEALQHPWISVSMSFFCAKRYTEITAQGIFSQFPPWPYPTEVSSR